MKKKILIISIILLLVIGGFIIYKINSKTIIDEEKTVNNVTFYDSSITKKKDKYIFNVKIKTNKDINYDRFEADFKDKKGKTIEVLYGKIGELKKGDSLKIKIETTKSLKKAYQISYTIYNQ